MRQAEKASVDNLPGGSYQPFLTLFIVVKKRYRSFD
jgi:hypothetical protein